MSNITLADDLLKGCASIAAHIGSTERKTYYLCERGQIPAFKIGNVWHARKTQLDVHFRCASPEAA